MNKVYILIITSLCLASSAFAKQVELETIKRVGTNFFYERLSQHQQVNYSQLMVKKVFPEKSNGTTVYYVLNFPENGFVIVSADDAVTPILAYSFEGNYSEENHPPQFKFWMDHYARQIEYCKKNNIAANQQITEDWTRLKTNDQYNLKLAPLPDVAPLIISTWDQGANYNALCPADGAGPDGKVWAGCVATAMSQVMYYYRFPSTGTGSHCYNPYGYSQQCADFANTNYRWNEMMNSINFRDTAVAELIWHCGVSVDMMYSPTGSGAYSEDALTAFINNFRYSPNAHLEPRDNYPPDGDEFPAILRDNLDHKRPMYYDGYGTGGHAFNVDGYQGTNFFHFNWGWSGSFNGYYYLNNLNPGGDNFNSGQRAMVNLYPDTLTNTYPAYCSGQMVLTSLSGTFEDGSGPKNYHNNANASWLIHPQSDSDSVTTIILTFNKFNTEQGNDLVKIYKGTTISDSLIGTYSGSSLPPSIRITGNRALVTFSTNSSITSDGWFATFSTETMTWCREPVTITDLEGIISDGSMDFNYKNNTNCRWLIDSDGENAVTLTFSSFNTEAGHDFVRIFELGNTHEIAKYSGDYADSDLPSPVTAPNGKMFILFQSNGITTDKGWTANYFIHPVGTQEYGMLTKTKIFPNPVSDKLNIEFHSSKSHRIFIDMSTIEGRCLLSSGFDVTSGSDLKTIDVSEFPKGIYLLHLTDEDETTIKKIMIQ
jgi:hypothetical protein